MNKPKFRANTNDLYGNDIVYYVRAEVDGVRTNTHESTNALKTLTEWAEEEIKNSVSIESIIEDLLDMMVFHNTRHGRRAIKEVINNLLYDEIEI